MCLNVPATFACGHGSFEQTTAYFSCPSPTHISLPIQVERFLCDDCEEEEAASNFSDSGLASSPGPESDSDTSIGTSLGTYSDSYSYSDSDSILSDVLTDQELAELSEFFGFHGGHGSDNHVCLMSFAEERDWEHFSAAYGPPFNQMDYEHSQGYADASPTLSLGQLYDVAHCPDLNSYQDELVPESEFTPDTWNDYPHECLEPSIASIMLGYDEQLLRLLDRQAF